MILLTLRMILVFLILAVPALAMEFIWVVTPATHETSTGYHVLMSGTIKQGDYAKLRLFVRRSLERYKSHRFVTLDSNGGNLVEALKIARLLRSMYPSISVKDGKCASSCLYLYLSGATRFSSPESIGIHRAYFDPAYFSGLKIEEARQKQIELTSLLNAILDENGVSQDLKDKMNRTSSMDVYWLSKTEIRSLGMHPAWYEEWLIAKCDYGKFRSATKEVREKLDRGGEVEGELLDKVATTHIKSNACEDKIVRAELSKLAISLAVYK